MVKKKNDFLLSIGRILNVILGDAYYSSLDSEGKRNLFSFRRSSLDIFLKTFRVTILLNQQVYVCGMTRLRQSYLGVSRPKVFFRRKLTTKTRRSRVQYRPAGNTSLALFGI